VRGHAHSEVGMRVGMHISMRTQRAMCVGMRRTDRWACASALKSGSVRGHSQSHADLGVGMKITRMFLSKIKNKCIIAKMISKKKTRHCFFVSRSYLNQVDKMSVRQNPKNK